MRPGAAVLGSLHLAFKPSVSKAQHRQILLFSGAVLETWRLQLSKNMLKRTIGSLVALACSATALKLAPELPPAALSRRAWGDAVAWGAAAAWGVAAPAAQALVTNPICASGVGDGCAELAAGESPLIAELQARSAEKREQRRKESLERYSVNNFNDFFAVDNKSLVRHADGTFEALPKDVIAEGLKSGRIKYGARSAGIADFSTTRAPFEFNESVSPATTPSSSNENLQ